MNNHITYLFGAGASFNAMPVVDEINAEIQLMDLTLREHREHVPALSEFLDWLDDRSLSHSDARLASSQRLSDLLMTEANQFQSIDTYAKWLGHTGQDARLTALRKLVDLYFCVRHYLSASYSRMRAQTIDTHYGHTVNHGYRSYWENDMRFDSLFASLIEARTKHLPKNISFLTWNYDLLFEYAYYRFNDYRKFPMMNPAMNEAPVIHLNGHATKLKEEHLIVNRVMDGLSPITEISEEFWNNRTDGAKIEYAWEMSKERIAELKSVADQTTHLVAIGYSFPVFNRSIDKIILSGAKIRTLTLQAPEPDLPEIANRVKSLIGERIFPYYNEAGRTVRLSRGSTSVPSHVHRTYPAEVSIVQHGTVDQFHIPFELA